MMQRKYIFGLEFHELSLEDWINTLIERSKRDEFSYVVTPNVDHVVKYHSSTFPKEIYDAALYRICDSRILRLIARIKGKNLLCLPGSDIVETLMQRDTERLVIAVFGPSYEDFAKLAHLYPQKNLKFIYAAESLEPNTSTWHDAVDEICKSDFDILLCCISFPKQEKICYDVSRQKQSRGLAICAGASLDFLVGRQIRAPKLMQKFGLEWLFRLTANPQKMWRRYLNGLRILKISFQSK